LSKEDLITQEQLKELFNYNPETGELIRLVSTSSNNKIGSVAGTRRLDGYRVIRVNKIQYLEHRIIWLYVYGKFPENLIDHIDGNPCNNRIANLRDATNTQNVRSRNIRKAKSGYRGITEMENGKFRVRLVGKHVGIYETLEEAIIVSEKSAKNIFGNFYRDLS